MWNQARAIVWAQWRTARNYIPRSNRAGLIFSGVLLAFWYAGFGFEEHGDRWIEDGIEHAPMRLELRR